MTPKKIESIELDNGLTLNLYDASRKVAADRWLIKLEANIEIEVSDHHFNDKTPLPAPLAQMRAKLGDKISYTYKDERNFVDRSNKDALFGQMQTSILAQKPYYSNPDFAARFIIKEFARHRHLPDRTE